MTENLWDISEGNEPLVATAIHDGHEVRDEVRDLLKLSEGDRLREEDPYTGRLAAAFSTHIIPKRSRFEVDLNRSREQAVYVEPEDAWGLDVWKEKPDHAFIDRSLSLYDAFYDMLQQLYSKMTQHHGAIVVFDIHSYNHLRNGPDGEPANPAGNPEINVGTGTMNRDRWAPVVDRFINDIRNFDFAGRHLDVRENVKFVGKQHPAWAHNMFPDSVCVLAIEFKKFFMNEWTDEIYQDQFSLMSQALVSTVPGMLEEIHAFNPK